jgi:SNF2 family DNA or RNA helicase
MFMKTEPDRYDFEDLLLKKVQYNIMALDTIARGKETGDNDEKGEPIVKYLWSDLINLSRFDLIIVDEVHKCKNEEAGRTKALMLLKPKKFVALSGTPILNRPAEFAPILSKVDPKNFANTHQFAVRYSDGKNGAKNTKELAELLRPIMIRRKKSEVLPDLPPVIPMVEQYIMNDREQQLYDAVFNQVLDAIPDILPAEDDRFNFFANNFLVKIMRLKQVCALMVADSVSEFAHDAYHNSESDHKKVIIFSQFIPVVEKIFKNLGNEALFITGESHSPTERLKIVKEFNADPHYKYLVASTKAASEQLNITAAGTVIFNDLMWTPADHDQAIGRAYGRLNDCHGVDAHFFVVKDTIMAWIQGILSQKSDTFKSVVDGVEVDRQNNTSVIQELIKMLRGMKKK